MGRGLYYNNLTIPIEMIAFAFERKLLKAFTLYIFLKFHCAGKIDKRGIYRVMNKISGFKDCRSINKHLEELLKLDWIGYAPLSGNYFIRSFDRVRQLNCFKKRHAAVCYPKDLQTLQSFMVGAMLCKSINVKKFISVSKGRKDRMATHKRDVAFQPYPKPQTHTDYFGLSNGLIAKLLFCKVTRASELKNQAAKDGYIKVKHRYRKYAVLVSLDLNFKKNIKESDPKFGSRLSIKPEKDGTYVVREQLYDEIIPLVWIKSIKKFGALKKAA